MKTPIEMLFIVSALIFVAIAHAGDQSLTLTDGTG